MLQVCIIFQFHFVIIFHTTLCLYFANLIDTKDSIQAPLYANYRKKSGKILQTASSMMYAIGMIMLIPNMVVALEYEAFTR